MAWISLILAGICEMFGVLMINKLYDKRNWQSFIMLMFCFGMSFVLLAYAMETLPMGTAYAIWTGIGASGGAILGMFLYGESTDKKRIFFIVVILVAVICLKFVS